jgi:hypothetical protein
VRDDPDRDSRLGGVAAHRALVSSSLHARWPTAGATAGARHTGSSACGRWPRTATAATAHVRAGEAGKAIYDARRKEGIKRIAVVGDFNDTPDSNPLKPLLAEGSTLRDIFEHFNFQDDGHPGTFGSATKSQKIDYILLSPELFKVVENAEVFRKGVWAGKNGDKFEHFEEMTKPIHAASDHAALVVDLNI